MRKQEIWNGKESEQGLDSEKGTKIESRKESGQNLDSRRGIGSWNGKEKKKTEDEEGNLRHIPRPFGSAVRHVTKHLHRVSGAHVFYGSRVGQNIFTAKPLWRLFSNTILECLEQVVLDTLALALSKNSLRMTSRYAPSVSIDDKENMVKMR